MLKEKLRCERRAKEGCMGLDGGVARTFRKMSHLSERQRHPHPARSSRTDSAAVSDERFLLPDRRS